MSSTFSQRATQAVTQRMTRSVSQTLANQGSKNVLRFIPGLGMAKAIMRSNRPATIQPVQGGAGMLRRASTGVPQAPTGGSRQMTMGGAAKLRPSEGVAKATPAQGSQSQHAILQ